MKAKTTYQCIEEWFENLVGIAVKIYGHPFTFVAALSVVILFLLQSVQNYGQLKELVGDILLSIMFLSFFIIQRAVNKSTAAIRLKINELIAVHDKASNDLLSVEDKTETELEKLADKHTDQTNRSGQPNLS